MDEIYDKFAAGRMGIDQIGQVVLMIHCGSRGKLGSYCSPYPINEFQI